MPQGLASSAGETIVPGNDKLTLVPTATTSTSSTPIKINTNAVLNSVCDTLLGSQGSTPTTPVSNPTVNLVVVSESSMTSSVTSSTNPTPIPSVTYTTSGHQYKLSEIVNQEKNVLFKQGNNSGLELEPPRGDVLTVRRRSRQFFTLVEEDEVDRDLPLAQESIDSLERQPEVQVDPILNLGDSLRRLYMPKERAEYRHKKRNRNMAPKPSNNDCDEERENRQPVSKSVEPPLSAGYESDGGKFGLFDKVFLNPELRSYSGSNPCVHEIPDIDSSDIMMVGSRKSKSLPTTPRVSPKLLRKQSMMTEKNTEPVGPGYSFLASVAGDVRLKKMKNEQNHSQQMQRISERNKKYGLKKEGSDTGLVKASDLAPAKASDMAPVKANDTAIVTRELSTVTVSGDHLPHELEHTNHVSDFSDYLGHKYDMDKPKPMIQSLINWGTQKKVKVSNKETNMFSPTSF